MKCAVCSKSGKDVKFVIDPYEKYPKDCITTDNTVSMNLCYDCERKIKEQIRNK